MTPLEFHKSIQELLQWDADRIAALLTGLFFGVTPVWWFLRRKRTVQSSGDDGVQRADQEVAELRAKVRGLTEDKQHLEQENQTLKEEVAHFKGEAEAIELDRMEDEPEETRSPLGPRGRKLGGIKTERWHTYSSATQTQRQVIERFIQVPASRRGFRYVTGKGSDSILEPGGQTVLKILPPVPRLADAFAVAFSLFLGIRTPHDCWAGLSAPPQTYLANVQGVEFEVFGLDANDAGAAGLINHILARL